MIARQVSTRQFVVVQFLIALAVKMFMLPALMLRVVGKDSYIVMLAWIAFEFIDLTFVLLLARRNPDKTMYEILTDAFGKVVSRVIVALFTLFVCAKGLLVLGELKTFFVVTMYADINWVVMLIPLMALLCAFGIRSLRSIGRTAELMTPVILVSTLVLSGLLLGDIEFSNLLPVMSNGFAPIKKGMLTFPMWFGDVSFLLMFLGNIKINRGFIWKSYLAKLVALALVMLFSVTLFSTYANVSTLIDYGNQREQHDPTEHGRAGQRAFRPYVLLYMAVHGVPQTRADFLFFYAQPRLYRRHAQQLPYVADLRRRVVRGFGVRAEERERVVSVLYERREVRALPGRVRYADAIVYHRDAEVSPELSRNLDEKGEETRWTQETRRTKNACLGYTRSLSRCSW